MLNQINSNIENQIDIIHTAYMTAEQFSSVFKEGVKPFSNFLKAGVFIECDSKQC